MFPFFTRARVIGGSVAAVAVIALGGVALAAHTSTGAPSTAAAPTSSAIPTLGGAPPSAAHKGARAAAVPKELVGKVVSVSATAITVSDAQGASRTFTVAAGTAVTSSSNQRAVITQLPLGEVVVVRFSGPPKHAAAVASPGALPAQATAISVHDTGFRSA